MSSASRTSASPRSTPLLSFQRPLVASQRQTKRRRVVTPSRPKSLRHEKPISSPRNVSVIEEEYADESLDHVIMAIDIKERNTVGCAYYLAREEKLFCMEDIANGGIDIVNARRYHQPFPFTTMTIPVKVAFQPTTVLLSPRADAVADNPDQLGKVPRPSLVDDGRRRPTGKIIFR